MPVKFPVESPFYPNANSWKNRDALAEALSDTIADEVRCILDEDNDIWTIYAKVQYYDYGTRGFQLKITNEPELFQALADSLEQTINADWENISQGS